MQDTLDKIYMEAKRDCAFLRELLTVKVGRNPMIDFCELATQKGFKICPGDFFDYGETYSCNQLKSTNGGGVNPYNYFDDPFEMFYVRLESLSIDKNDIL